MVKIPCITNYESDEEEALQGQGQESHKDSLPHGADSEAPPKDLRIPLPGKESKIDIIYQSFSRATDHFLKISSPKHLQQRASEQHLLPRPDPNQTAETTKTDKDSEELKYRLRYTKTSDISIYSRQLDGIDLRITK